MKNTRKKYSILMLALTLAIAFTFYGCSSSQNKLVGRWESMNSGVSDLEFFSDGTCTRGSVEGIYSIDGDRIKLSSLVLTSVYTFEIKNNTLNLTRDDGTLYASFEKVD